MELIERSYSGKLFRPRPEIYIENKSNLLIIATPWGPRSAAKRAIEIIKEYFFSRQQDHESTSPFSRLTCMSQLANDLRVAIKLANDTIYNEDNKNEYISGLELFVVARSELEIAWVQVGYPGPFLDRNDNPLLPLGSLQDLSVEFSTMKMPLPPLPHKLLGLDMSSDFTVESFRPKANDHLILLSRPQVPASVFLLQNRERTLDNISRLMARDNTDLPFWLGIIKLKAA